MLISCNLRKPKLKTKYVPLITILVMIGLLSVFAWPAQECFAKGPGDLIDKQAPPFIVTDLNKTRIDLDDAGKVFLIDFWATWCAPCRETTSVMTSLHNMYSDQGLVVLGIAVNDNESNVRKYVSEHGIVYPVIARQSRDDTPLIKIIQDYGVQAIPTLVLIDKSGVVRHVSIGVSPDRAKFQEGLGNLIVGLLKEGQ